MILVVSDFSFAERAVIDVWIWLWFIIRVWDTDKFASLQWNKICNFDLKSVITLLIFLMLPSQAIFDIVWTYIKYQEGYVDDDKGIYTKPTYDLIDGKLLWSRQNEILKTITEYMLALCFAFQIGTLALMQAFWSHLSSQMGGKPFLRTWEFRFYVTWVFVSMFLFPMARGLVGLIDKNKSLTEWVPQVIFSTQMFVIFLLGIKNGYKLNNLLKSIQHTNSPSGQETILRIHYFIEMNQSLMTGAFLISVGILIISISTLASKGSFTSKFLLDILMIHVNFGSLILWVTMILIIYPRYYITGSSGKVLNNSTHGRQGRHVSIEPCNNPYIANINTTTTTTVTTATPPQPSTPSTPSRIATNSIRVSQVDNNIEKSINNLLEEQNQQIEIFRHKTSTSISSTITIASNHGPTSPLIPPPPLFPPPAANKDHLEDINHNNDNNNNDNNNVR